jgi:hypothetical protein
MSSSEEKAMLDLEYLTYFVVLIDTTSSMGVFLESFKEVMNIVYEFLPLFGAKPIIIEYGDSCPGRTTFDRFVNITQNVTRDTINNIKLSNFGGGGDSQEALNSALFLAKLKLQLRKMFFLVVNDACGYTGLNRTMCSCSYDESNREPEFQALEKAGIKRCDATTIKMVELLAKEENVVSCITSCRCIANDKVYPPSGGFCEIVSGTKDSILKALFKALQDAFNLAPTQQRTKVLPNSRPIWNKMDIDLFRTLVLKNPTILEHLGCLAGLYYGAVKRTSDFANHGVFMKHLAENGTSAKVRELFKAAQNEMDKDSIFDYQKKDETGPRIIGEKILLTTLIDILTFVTRTDSRKALKELFSGLRVIVDPLDPLFDTGIPLSVITKDLSLLISYLGRDDGNYIVKVNNRTALASMLASLLYWSPINDLTEVSATKVKDEDFLNSDRLMLDPMAYNMTWLQFVVNAYRRIMPEKNMQCLYKMFMLVKIIELSKQSFELTSIADVSRMTIVAMLEHISGVMMFFDVALRQWYPSFLVCKCDITQVGKIVKNMKIWHIGTNSYHEALLALCLKYGFLYLSIYAINFYTLPDNDTILDLFMTQSHTTLPFGEVMCDEKTLENVYETKVRNSIFSNIVSHKELVFARNVICNTCGALYARADSRFKPALNCPNCRFKNHVVGDNRPTVLNQTFSITCVSGKHTFLTNFETSEKIQSNICPFCNIDVAKITKTETLQNKNIIMENIDFWSNSLGISTLVLSRLISTGSAYNTVADVIGDKKSINPDVVSWHPIPFNFSFQERKDEEQLILRIRGCPLISSCVEKVLTCFENGFKLTCMFCFEEKPYNEFKKVCSRTNCIADICTDCVMVFHPCHIGHENEVSVFHGNISARQLSCTACTSPIDLKAKMKNFGLIRYLFANRAIIAMNGTQYPNMAAAVFDGVKMWRCSNGLTCPALRNRDANHGIFEVEKQACAINIEIENEVHICGVCIQIKMDIAKREAEKEKKLVLEVDPFGFYIIDGIRVVQCPNCKNAIERNEGCAHMTCECGQHFCYCCSLPFENSTKTYAHLHALFRTAFPSDSQIERMSMRRINNGFAIAHDSDFDDSDDENPYNEDGAVFHY